jgi:lipid-binding SYLF domain-containing protein
MKTLRRALTTTAALGLVMATAQAAPHNPKYADTVALFQNAGQSSAFFSNSYAYAVFPTVGEGAFVVGGAGGKGRVYVHGQRVGDTTVAQVSVGFQAGGKAYSEIIFFQDQRALDEFESGHFVIAITAAAGASAGTTGEDSGASGGDKNARTQGQYYKGVAVFTVAKGGLMYQAAVAGQKFSYTPLAAS